MTTINPTKLFATLILTVSLTSCNHKTWQITSRQSLAIPIDSLTEPLADTAYKAQLKPYKLRIDSIMNEVIGQSAETMQSHKPESSLSNFNADVYRSTATLFTKEKIDIAIVNMGGLRTAIPQGNITVRKIFELMPFENELVVLWLRGDRLLELLQQFAKNGGEGVSGLHMEINREKAENITINGTPVNPGKLYSIATNDYLAGGNDKMTQLALYEKRVNTGLKIRDVLINHIKEETKKGNKIQSKIDGRITLIP